MKIIQFIFCFLLAIFLCGFGCSTSKPTPDPLAGWTLRQFDDFAPPSERHHYQLDKMITDDYQDFLKKNSLDTTAITGFYEDGTGQRAVEFEAFEIGPNVKTSEINTSWHYVLIYDKENKRIKTIKYGCLHYQS
jgi:hypothetical protein